MPLQVVKLTGEQKKVLFLSPKNPIGIKGVAGCGKTTVALYRAKQLLDTYRDLFSEANVAIFTFNKSLVKYMDTLLPIIPGGYQENSDVILDVKPGMNITVTNFHKWAYHFLVSKGIKMITLDDNQVYSKISEAKKNFPQERIALKSVEFFKDEISWIKGRMITNEQEYLEIERKGRGKTVRVTRTDRNIIWKIYQLYQKSLRQENAVDFSDYALLCHKYINENDRVFSHLIIDEAQDLTKAQLMLLYKLVYTSTNSITIIADAAQRIYKSAFSWADTGLELRGRTVVLKINYRNTYEIADAAFSLINHDDDPSDFTEGNLNTRRHGKKPEIEYFPSDSEQYAKLCNTIKKIRKENSKISIVVLHRTTQGTNELYNCLTHNSIPCQEIRNESNLYISDKVVNICTMSSIKGLEFDYVFIVSLNNDIVPLLKGYDTSINAEDDIETQIEAERRLLYVCMTRAKEELYLYVSGTPSRFISEIDHDKIIVNQKCCSSNITDDDLPF